MRAMPPPARASVEHRTAPCFNEAALARSHLREDALLALASNGTDFASFRNKTVLAPKTRLELRHGSATLPVGARSRRSAGPCARALGRDDARTARGGGGEPAE